MSRFMDLVEANRERDHKERMARRRARYGWAAVAAVFGVAALVKNHNDNNTIEIIEFND